MHLDAVDYHAPDASEQFVASLHRTGFGVLKHHPINVERVEAIYADWLAWFNTGPKHDYRYNVGTQDGYFPPDVSETAKGHSQKDLKEYFHFYPWGQCPAELREALQRYYDTTTALASQLLAWVELHSPPVVAHRYLEPLSMMIQNSGQTLLRVLHYPPMRGDEEPGAVRAAAHEDINLLTILPTADEPGLQVLDRDHQWYDVPCDPGTLVVNIGDMLQEASGGYFPSTTHRVVNPEGMDRTKARMSLPLFLHPRPDVRLSERYTAEQYLQERLRELGVV